VNQQNTTPADELRAAATKLRGMAKDATRRPWAADASIPYGHRVGSSDDADWVARTGEYGRGLLRCRRRVIAAMHPGVGAALADWLDTGAELWARVKPSPPSTDHAASRSPWGSAPTSRPSLSPASSTRSTDLGHPYRPEARLGHKLAKGFNSTNVPLEFGLLTAEIGEAFTARRKNLPDFGEELADVFLYLVALAEMTGMDLSEKWPTRWRRTPGASTSATSTGCRSGAATGSGRDPARLPVRRLLPRPRLLPGEDRADRGQEAGAVQVLPGALHLPVPPGTTGRHDSPAPVTGLYLVRIGRGSGIRRPAPAQALHSLNPQ
jgi:hypothetical protein